MHLQIKISCLIFFKVLINIFSLYYNEENSIAIFTTASNYDTKIHTNLSTSWYIILYAKT